jgi:hypothetical protein
VGIWLKNFKGCRIVSYFRGYIKCKIGMLSEGDGFATSWHYHRSTEGITKFSRAIGTNSIKPAQWICSNSEGRAVCASSEFKGYAL